MTIKEFEKILNDAIKDIDDSKYAKSFRYMGFNLHFTSNIGTVPGEGILADLKVGLEGTNRYISVFYGYIDRHHDVLWLLNRYEPAINQLHKWAVGIRYGSIGKKADTVMFDTDAEYTAVIATPTEKYIKEDTDMTYTFMNKPTGHGGTRWLTVVEPKKIHFNGPATIVEWNDGTKTVVKCQRGDKFDPLTGVAMCCMKKMLGSNESGSNYLSKVEGLIDDAITKKDERYRKNQAELMALAQASNDSWNEYAKKMDEQLYKVNKAIEEANRFVQSAEDDINGGD